MSTTQSPGYCIEYGTFQAQHYLPSVVSRTISTGQALPSAVLDQANNVMLSQFGEQFRKNGFDISDEEVNELRLFDEFLACHVQPSGVFNVQCMLLWNEWVRTFRRRTHGFPKLIREKEFRIVVKDKFGIDIADLEHRGEVYPGIRYVP